VEEAFIRKAPQKNKKKEKLVAKFRKNKMSKKEQDSLILKAISEFGDRALYTIRNGTIGQTIYAYADTKDDAHVIRELMPLKWNNLYCIVIYDSDPEPEEEDEYEDWLDPVHYDPK